MAAIDIMSTTNPERKMLILYLNTGTSTTPTWSAIGKYVSDSSMEYDWGEETNTDILGNTYTTLKPPTITQSFDTLKPTTKDSAVVKIWQQAIRDQDIGAMQSNDLLVVHLYAGSSSSAMFAERYPESMVKPSSLGGSTAVDMAVDVTFGGERSTGTASVSNGVVTYTAA